MAFAERLDNACEFGLSLKIHDPCVKAIIFLNSPIIAVLVSHFRFLKIGILLSAFGDNSFLKTFSHQWRRMLLHHTWKLITRII